MAEDIVPTLLAEIQEEFAQRIKRNSNISRIMKYIESGKAGYADANEYAIEIGEELASVFKKHLSSSSLPDGRMYFNIADRILNATLGENHRLISDVIAQVQTSLNEAAGIGIKAIRPELNQDRIDGIVNRVSSEKNFDDVAWILDEPVVNFSQSVVDDAIKENADFHYSSGLSPKIIRTSTGKCCKWCDNLAGTYDYHSVKNTGNDVFRRHERCRCTVDYDPGSGKRQNVHSKKWSVSMDEAKLEARKVIGLKAGNTVIEGLSQHVIERMAEREVTGDDILDTILHPLDKTEIKFDERNRPFFNVIGSKSTISVNPESGIITTTHKTHKKLIEKYRKGKR